MNRAKLIERAIRLAWSSLESHLPYTYKGKEQAFDRKCVAEYAEIIQILTQLY